MSSPPVRAFSLVVVLLAAGCPRPDEPPAGPRSVAPADRWAGTFVKPDMRVALARQEDGSYGGQIELGAQTFPLRARADGDALSGTFDSGGHAFAFTATLGGSALSLTTGGKTHVLQREEASNPLAEAAPNPLAGRAPTATAPADAAATPPAGEAPPPAPPAAPTGWTEYRHPLGLIFRHPTTWSPQEAGDGLALVPADVARNAQGQTEAFLINSVPAEGVTRPDAPEAVAYFDQQVRASFPFLARTGPAEPVRLADGAGTVLTWTGTNPAGMKVRARMYVTIFDDFGVFLLAVGDADRIAARDDTARVIFSSFRYRQPPLDARLYGNWLHERHFFSGNFSSTTMRNLVLRPDGTCLSSSRLLAGMEHTDAGGAATGRTDADTGRGDVDRGKWRTTGDRLLLLWSDGSEEAWRFHIENDALLLTPERGGDRRLFMRQ